eukprot:545777_1
MSNDNFKANQFMNLLSVGLALIYGGKSSTVKWEQLYRYAYTLVVYSHGDTLYNGHLNILNTHLQSIRPGILALDQLNDFQFLKRIINTFEQFQLKATRVKDVLMYMDATYCDIKQIPNSIDISMKQFVEQIVTKQHQFSKYSVLIIAGYMRAKCVKYNIFVHGDILTIIDMFYKSQTIADRIKYCIDGLSLRFKKDDMFLMEYTNIVEKTESLQLKQMFIGTDGSTTLSVYVKNLIEKNNTNNQYYKAICIKLQVQDLRRIYVMMKKENNAEADKLNQIYLDWKRNL